MREVGYENAFCFAYRPPTPIAQLHPPDLSSLLLKCWNGTILKPLGFALCVEAFGMISFISRKLFLI